MTATFKIENLKLIAQGRQKAVYQHPDNELWLIKIINRNYRKEISNSFFRRSRYGGYLSLLRQVQEVFAAHSWGGGAACEHLEQVVGFVDTDQGLGLVVARVIGPDEGLENDLPSIIKARGLKTEELAGIDTLLNWLARGHVVVYDLNLGNVLLNEHSKPVLIDGIGGTRAFSFRALLPWYNRIKIRRKIKRFRWRLSQALQIASA